MDYVRMGDILRERRAEYGLMERQLAKFVGISPVYYSQIERGVCHIDLETLVKLAEALRLSADELLDLKNSRMYLDG